MKIGMLWFDNDRKTDLIAKVETAAAYYQSKYGVRPNLCYIHPSMTQEPINSEDCENDSTRKLKAGHVEIRTNKSIMPNHLWIGVNGTLNHTNS